MRWIALFLLVSLTMIAMAGYATEGYRGPLDLPSGGRGAEVEEEAVEVIHFYGSEYEGDAFFWCLDRSCSMDWGGRIGILKAETTAAIQSLTGASEFSVVAFSDWTNSWSSIPREATPANRVAASAWVGSLTAEGATCIAPAVATALEIARASDKQEKQVIVLSDGVPTCSSASETLSQVAGANWEGIPIHTIYISSDSEGIGLMQGIANNSGGTFRLVQ